MPPKQRFCAQDVSAAAFAVVRRQGWKGLSARSIAAELNASTRPIYDHLQSMQAIEEEVVRQALELFFQYLSTPETGDRWLDQALGYLRFASQEKHLFRCINDAQHMQIQKKLTRPMWVALGRQLDDDPRFSGLPAELKNRIRTARWFFLHGMAHLVNNEWFSISDEEDRPEAEMLDKLHGMLRDINALIHEGYTRRAAAE
ncbi:MAG: TetR/AcrR family transcriptional regulator [Desulfobacteraceae bacterium]|jgi:AcrR family transcriptional regulator|nr:TetR/AcrR family transcriptional regulator [Desulfobacteraceae bacterium]